MSKQHTPGLYKVAKVRVKFFLSSPSCSNSQMITSGIGIGMSKNDAEAKAWQAIAKDNFTRNVILSTYRIEKDANTEFIPYDESEHAQLIASAPETAEERDALQAELNDHKQRHKEAMKRAEEMISRAENLNAELVEALESLLDPQSGEFFVEYKAVIKANDRNKILKAIKKQKGNDQSFNRRNKQSPLAT